jgi:hypothetical protein
MEMTDNELVSIIRNLNVMELGKEQKLSSILAWGIYIFVRALHASSFVDSNSSERANEFWNTQVPKKPELSHIVKIPLIYPLKAGRQRNRNSYDKTN